MAINVYIVETHYSYEGSTVEWAGVSFDKAKAYADALDTSGDVTICRWRDGECLMRWDRYDETYSVVKRQSDGTWKPGGSIERAAAISSHATTEGE